MQQAIRFIKKNYPSLYVITDVCFCEYTSHGHCGIIHDNDVDNDATLGQYSQASCFSCKSRCRYGSAIRYDGWNH